MQLLANIDDEILLSAVDEVLNDLLFIKKDVGLSSASVIFDMFVIHKKAYEKFVDKFLDKPDIENLIDDIANKISDEIERAGESVSSLTRNLNVKASRFLGRRVVDDMLSLREAKVREMYKLGQKSIASKLQVPVPRINALDRKILDSSMRYDAHFSERTYRQVAHKVKNRIKDLRQKLIAETPSPSALAIKRRLRREIRNQMKVGAHPTIFAHSSVVAIDARSCASLVTMNRLGVEKYRIVAEMDERTCEMCEYMNGTEFGVAAAMKNLKKEIELTPSGKLRRMKKKQEVVRRKLEEQKKETDSDLVRFADRPPYHPGCRCHEEPIGIAA